MHGRSQDIHTQQGLRSCSRSCGRRHCRKTRHMHIVFNGYKFTRYPNSPRISDQRYYRGRVPVNGRKIKVYLHRYMWEVLRGPIPDGFDVHHVDGDTQNNTIENLACVEKAEHLSHHANANWSDPEFRSKMQPHIERIIEAAKPWHSSPEGKAWHSENARTAFAKREPREIKCAECGNMYTTTKAHGSYACSNKCWRLLRDKDPKRCEHIVCLQCGTGFTATRIRRKRYCSSACFGKSRTGMPRSRSARAGAP